MSRKTFLSIVAVTATLIGLVATLLPETLLVVMKAADPNPAALTMARTAGVLLIAVGMLNFLVRSHKSSPTLHAVLIANLVLQLLLLPIDPAAYVMGVYGNTGSFVPNTILHLVLVVGFVYFIRRMSAELKAA